MPGPDFLIAGAARGGSTALYKKLAAHPALLLCEPKEPHFLAHAGIRPNYAGPRDEHTINRVTVSDPARYAELFAAKGPDQLAGEASVSTMAYPERSIAAIRDYCSEDIKLIFCLRDPAKRAFSAHQYLRSRGIEPIADVLDAIAQEPLRIEDNWHHMWHYLRLSRYDKLLAPFLASFHESQIHIVISEQLGDSSTMRDVHDFLGVDHHEVVIDQVNRGGEPRSRMVAFAASKLAGNAGLVGAIRKLAPGLEKWAFRQEGPDDSVVESIADMLQPTYAFCHDLLGTVTEWTAGA